MIYIKNISKVFNDNEVLKDVSFTIDDNAITSIIGPNGIGKTTIFNIVCGILMPDHGIIESDLNPHNVFTVLSGNHSLYAKNTVGENIFFFSLLRGISSSKVQENIEKYYKYFPVYNSIKNKLFEELSFGQKRLATIFAALVTDSKYLLLDEPTEGLDLENKKHLQSVLVSVKKFKTILLTSHDPYFVSALSDQVVFLNDAKVAAISKSLSLEQLIKNYEEIYGGTAL